MSEYTDVRDFQLKFNQLVSFYPRHLTTRKLTERGECMLEELTEFFDAAGLEVFEKSDGSFGVKPSGGPQDMAGMADALVDLVYFALGAAVMMGLPWKELWDDVHRANMAKVAGITHRNHKVDVTKPPGWLPPQTHEILAAVGYKESEPGPQVDDLWATIEEHGV